MRPMRYISFEDLYIEFVSLIHKKHNSLGKQCMKFALVQWLYGVAGK